MKKIIKLVLISAVVCFGLSACTGVITGHEYKKEDLVVAYKVIKNGVTTFMTQEEIEQAKLDKVDVYLTDTYKLLTPTELADEKALEVKESEVK